MEMCDAGANRKEEMIYVCCLLDHQKKTERLKYDDAYHQNLIEQVRRKTQERTKKIRGERAAR